MSEEKERTLIRITVNANTKIVEAVATLISEHLEAEGYELLDQSGLNVSHSDPAMGKVYINAR